MPIMTATRSTVSRASDGCCDHQVFGLGNVFSANLPLWLRQWKFFEPFGAKARTAKVVGMCWASHGLTVEGQTNRLEGSNAGVGGGVGPVELFMRARWIGVFAGLDA